MSKKFGKKKERRKTIALQRIHRLFTLAEQAALQNRMSYADRYVAIARRLSMKYLVPIPVEYKRRYCTHCYAYLLPSVTCQVRVHRSTIITCCNHCNKYSRIPLNKENNEKKG